MDNQALTLIKSGKTQVIFIRDILYCEVFNHQVRIHTVHGTYDYFGTLDMLETKLDERFFRCHRSFVVNMSCVAGQEKRSSNSDKWRKDIYIKAEADGFYTETTEFLEK